MGKNSAANRASNQEQPYKSRGEYRLASLFSGYGIPFIYEPRISVADGTRKRTLVPDFYLPKAQAYVEYFGRAGSEEYDRRTTEKLRLYDQGGVNVVAVYPWDLARTKPNALPENLEYLVAGSVRGTYTSGSPLPYAGRPRSGRAAYSGHLKPRSYRARRG